METDLVEVLELELKYCERCGDLWLRPLGGQEVYCSSCIPLIAELPLARRKRKAVIRQDESVLEGRCEQLLAICEGGQA